MLDLIKKHLAALGDSNWAEYKAGLASNAVYEESATMQHKTGADDYVKVVQAWKRAFPDLHAKILGSYASGDRVFAEVEWEGTHRGPLEGPMGTIPATNKRGTVKAAMIFTVKDGKITENHHFFDLMTILRQLGVAPTVGAPAPSPKAAAQPAKH